jgi:hypothetical protein
MKKGLIVILFFQLLLFCEVSLPSESYGARTYTRNNVGYVNISYPFDMGYNVVGDVDPDGRYINIISKYDSWQQKWYSSSYIPELELWATNFLIHVGNVYKIYVYNEYSPSLGFAGHAEDIPAYNLTTYLNCDYYYKGYNFIMHRPDKSVIQTATQLGNELVLCDYISKTNPYTNELISTAYDNTTGLWSDDFEIEITDPLMVNVWTPQLWPSEITTKEMPVNAKVIVGINNPMPVYYHIQSSSKGDYNFSEDNLKSSTITFKAWITGREKEILTHEDYGCGFEQIGDVFSAIYINLGNFETQWAIDDEVNFLVTDKGTKEISNNYLQGKGSYKLTYSDRPVLRGFEPVIKDSGDPLVVGTPASEDVLIPYETALYQNYPNPFNPTTTIKFSLKNDSKAQLSIFNYSGQLVKSMVNDQLDRGSHNIVFNADQLSSGVYYYTLKADNKTITKKMIIIK